MTFTELMIAVFTWGILIYSITLISSYLFIGVFSIGETITYRRKAKFTKYNKLLVTRHEPSVSLIAPAYNEAATIIDNVRSLLNVHYYKLEIIVVNDGSKDDTLAKIVQAYHMEKVDCDVPASLYTKHVRAVYKSKLPVFDKLIVIDKENGGKADALNAGINLAQGEYVVCIDADCILQQDAIIKLIKPFIDSGNKKVIATGGVIRIANSCIIRNGKLVKPQLPDGLLPCFQTLEYIRTFLLARMAWSRMDGLLLISGAFGAFDREILIKAGGYYHGTVGEDMELVVRMRRYMVEQNQPYKVKYIPDPLCWTEVPSDYRTLGRQRNRWMRGTYETLQLHKAMFFNPKYGIMGLISYPFWFFFELLGPVIELTGFFVFFILALLGLINWSLFFLLLGFLLSFGYLYSVFAILMEVATYNEYKENDAVIKLIGITLLEPFLFHPFVVWSSIMGFIDLLKNKKVWGEMNRKGFAKQWKEAV